MGPGRVAPPSIVARQRVVRRAEVRSRHEYRWRPRMAPVPVRLIRTLNLEARPAAEPIVEQSSAQRRSVHAIALAIQVTITTRATYKAGENRVKKTE